MALSVWLCPAAWPGTGRPAQVMEFTIDRPALPIPHYTIIVDQKGFGYYWEKAPELDSQGEPVAKKLTFSTATVDTVFLVKNAIYGTCETHVKHIADTGKKTLTYNNNDQSSSCTFNYSDEEKINAAVSVFEALAETMQAGERLKHKHRFDHLGLDAELDSLVAEAKDHRAIELQNIAAILQSIVNDEELMSPSRRKAESLLKMGN